MEDKKELKKFIQKLLDNGYTSKDIMLAARSVEAKLALQEIKAKGIYK